MNFDFSEDQKLLQKTVRDYLEKHSPLAAARETLETGSTHSPELWKGAAELGWLGATIPEEHGGAGFGHLELCLIAEEVGRALAPIPFSSSVYLFTEGILRAGSDSQQKEHLPTLASGTRIGTFALAEKPGSASEDSIQAKFEGGKLTGTKIAVADGQLANAAIVAVRGPEGVSLVIVDLDGDGVTREPLDSFDPSRPQATLRFDAAAAEVLGTPGEGWALAESLLDRAAVLMAFEQVGSAQRAFDITKDFTMGRYAFGRPVASFQAVKHRLADLWCAIELARSHSYYGAWALSGDEPELAIAAPGARVAATDALELAAVEMVQLHGGVGFTWEYDCHLFYRRSKLLGLTLGSAREWRDKLVRRLAAQQA